MSVRNRRGYKHSSAPFQSPSLRSENASAMSVLSKAAAAEGKTLESSSRLLANDLQPNTPLSSSDMSSGSVDGHTNHSLNDSTQMESSALFIHGRPVQDLYSLLILDIIAFEVSCTGLDIVKGKDVKCQVTFDHQTTTFTSQGMILPQVGQPSTPSSEENTPENVHNLNATPLNTDKNGRMHSKNSIVFPFDKKLNVLSNTESQDRAIMIKLGYSDGTLLGVNMSQIRDIAVNKEVQAIPILSANAKRIGYLTIKFSCNNEGFFEDSASESSSLISGSATVSPQSQLTTTPLSLSPSPVPMSNSLSRLRPISQEKPVMAMPPTEVVSHGYISSPESIRTRVSSLSTSHNYNLLTSRDITQDFEAEDELSEKSEADDDEEKEATTKQDEEIILPPNIRDENNSRNKIIFLSVFVYIAAVAIGLLRAMNPDSMACSPSQSITRLPCLGMGFIDQMTSYKVKNVVTESAAVDVNGPGRRTLSINGSDSINVQLLLFDGEEIVSQTSRGRQYSSPNESPQGDRLSLMGPVTSDHNKGANVSARQSIAAKERLLIWRAGFFGFSNLFNGFFGGYAAVSSDKKSSSWWSFHVTDKTLQLRHSKSSKCMCPIINRRDRNPLKESETKRLRLMKCSQCDAASGWTLDGSKGHLVYRISQSKPSDSIHGEKMEGNESMGSHKDYCLSRESSKKNGQVLLVSCNQFDQQYLTIKASVVSSDSMENSEIFTDVKRQP